MAEGKVTAESEVTSEDSVEEKARYVLHGGQAFCPCGSRVSRLQVPKCHGTYMYDMPLMVDKDNNPEENIQPFGYCYSQENEDRQKKAEEIMKAVEDKTSDLLGKAMDALNSAADAVGDAIAWLTGNKEEEVTPDKKEEYAQILMENIVIQCNPTFETCWQNASEDLSIKGDKALTTQSSIVCTKGKCEIFIVDDGQENAMSEQNNKQDLSNWKEGDPLPEPTMANLQQMEEAGLTDTDAYKAMKETIDILEDMNTQKLSCISEDEEECKKNVADWEKRKQEITDQYKSGKKITNGGNSKNEEEIEKKVKSKSKEKDIYYQGKLMSAEEYEKAIKK